MQTQSPQPETETTTTWGTLALVARESPVERVGASYRAVAPKRLIGRAG